MGKILCLLGFHRIERCGRFIEHCTRHECNAEIVQEFTGQTTRRYWRWDWSLFKAFR